MKEEINRDTLRIYAPGREFVLPYIVRELDDIDIVLTSTADNADITLIEPGSPIPDQVDTVLVCPNIVGTGMTDLPMEIARRIANGSYYHLAGNEARLSTIHASDVARAIRLARGSQGIFTVTDGADPTFHDFAEAIAFRLNHKRILTLGSKWVKWIISPGLRRLITKDCIVDGSDFAARFDFKPTPVIEYLRTHVYDERSL